MHLARVGVRVIVFVVDVVCLMFVLSAHVVLLGILFTHPVGDSKMRWLLPNFATVIFAPNSL